VKRSDLPPHSPNIQLFFSQNLLGVFHYASGNEKFTASLLSSPCDAQSTVDVALLSPAALDRNFNEIFSGDREFRRRDSILERVTRFDGATIKSFLKPLRPLR